MYFYLFILNFLRFDEGLSALKKEIDFHAHGENYAKINRCTVGVVIVYLYNGDPVEAEKFFHHSLRFVSYAVIL